MLDEKKTSADVEKEGEILTEMLEIVEKRDTLIALLEEERQRYCKLYSIVDDFVIYFIKCINVYQNIIYIYIFFFQVSG